MQYTVSDIYENASCLSSWLRGTQWVIYIRMQVIYVAGYTVGGTQWVIYIRMQVALVAGYAVHSE